MWFLQYSFSQRSEQKRVLLSFGLLTVTSLPQRAHANFLGTRSASTADIIRHLHFLYLALFQHAFEQNT